MITILHGDNIAESRNYFLELKSKERDVLSFDGSKITITDLVQNIEGSGLFNSTKTLFIEDFLSKTKKTDKGVKEILNFIVHNSEKATLVLWESKEIGKRDLFAFKNAINKIFKLPKNIFLFLDNLKPNNSKNLLNLFYQALDSGISEELILFMMQRQIRLLLALYPCHPELDGLPSGTRLVSGSQIDEISRLAPWQTTKLQMQTNLFDLAKLKSIYKKLYEIEIGHKTGGLNLSLTQSIDFFLLDI